MAAPVNIQAPSKTWELSLYELHRSPQVKLSVCPAARCKIEAVS